MTDKSFDQSSSSPAPTGMRAFTIIWLGQIISMLGSGLTRFALGMWVFNKTRLLLLFSNTEVPFAHLS